MAGIDLTGQKFNHLTAIEKTDKRYKDGTVIWKFQCDCDNKTIIEIPGYKVRNGQTKSCGCLQRKACQNDLVGNKYNKLTVVADSGKRDSQQHILWLCECDCGEGFAIVRKQDLETGHTKSCGCIGSSAGEAKIRDILLSNNIVFEQQKTFKDCFFKNAKSKSRFDFFLPDYNCLIEYDGEQHFYSREKGWNDKEHFNLTKQRDEYKNQWCKDNNIPLIRIPYTHYEDLCLEDLLPNTSKFLMGND